MGVVNTFGPGLSQVLKASVHENQTNLDIFEKPGLIIESIEYS